MKFKWDPQLKYQRNYPQLTFGEFSCFGDLVALFFRPRKHKNTELHQVTLKFLQSFFFVFVSISALSAQVNWPIVWDSAAIQQKRDYLNSIEKTNSKKPNIILIVADDLGYYDLSVYGNPYILTPNIDKLAYEGAICMNGYATAPICSPSRAGMLTGRYQQRFGYQMQPQQRYPGSKFEWWAFSKMNTSDIEPAPYITYPSKSEIPKQGLPPGEVTITEMLKQKGYATAWIGKWHLGYHEPLLPQNFGFDFTYGCYEAFTLFADPKDKNIVNAKIDEFTDKHIWKKGRKGPCAIRKNGTVINEKEYLTYAFEREAKDFITTHKQEPFFLYLPVNAPHTPYQAPKEIYDSLSMIKKHSTRVYYSMIIALDKMVGNIVAHLKKENLYENTMIIFTSDNGAALYSQTVTNEPLVGGKFTFYEGGISVPLIFHYPGKIKPKTEILEPVMLFDIYATIADIANIPMMKGKEIDGVSLMPYLTDDNNNEEIHEQLFWYSDYNRAIRKGNWKLILNNLDETMELYWLEGKNKIEDLEMKRNNSSVVVELYKDLFKWLAELPPMLWPRLVDYYFYNKGILSRWGV
jgi:arylsulfatase A-like enzyme